MFHFLPLSSTYILKTQFKRTQPHCHRSTRNTSLTDLLTIRNASLAGHSQRFTRRPFATLHSPTDLPFATLHSPTDLPFATLHLSAVRDDSVHRRFSLSHRRRFTSPHRCQSTVRDALVLRRPFVMIQSFAPSAMLPATIHSFAPSAMLPATLRLPPSRRLFAFHPQTCNGYFFFPFELIFVLIFV